MLKRRSFITVLVTFSLMILLAVSSTSSVFASEEGSTHNAKNANLMAAPNKIYHEESRLGTTPGPGEIYAHKEKYGIRYSGYIPKIDEQVDPDGPYYLSLYGGYLTK